MEQNAQTDFFQQIRMAVPSYQNLAQSIADVLDISTNEAYKKLRGSSKISLEQVIKLSETFNVPFVYSPQPLNTVTFSYPAPGSITDVTAYLGGLLDEIGAIRDLKAKHITVTTDDIPLFHIFKYPELTAFKFFFWTRKSGQVQFDESFLNPAITVLAQQLNALYLEVPSTEIWAKDTVSGTLEQIRYLLEAGYITDKALLIQLVEQVRYCVTDINMYAIGSKKTIDSAHAFNWYHCDVLGSIAYLIQSESEMACFNRFNTFNYLKTVDQNYCTQTKDWMNDLINQSVAFSGQGEKYRNRFVYQAFKACDELIQEIETMAG